MANLPYSEALNSLRLLRDSLNDAEEFAATLDRRATFQGYAAGAMTAALLLELIAFAYR